MYKLPRRNPKEFSLIGPIRCHKCKAEVTEFYTADFFSGIDGQYRGMVALCLDCHKVEFAIAVTTPGRII